LLNALVCEAPIWQKPLMYLAPVELTPKLVNALYTEAMLLADEARSYFDGDRERTIVPTAAAVAFSCESLKVTTRLMHIIAWLLNQKALYAGELSERDAIGALDELGYAPATDSTWLDNLPDDARHLIAASEDLYYRVQRVAQSVIRDAMEEPAPLQMIARLRQAF
jgi:regulator of CtrA degradation